MDAKLLIAPPLTVISPAAKFVVASLDVNVSESVLLLVLEPLLFTSEAVIVMVGDVTSYVQVNCAAVLLLPALSVNLFASISIVLAPSSLGVNVAVWTVLLTVVKSLMVPPLTSISALEKSPLCASLSVNVIDSVSSLLLSPLLTSAAVIVTVGEVESYVQVN